MGCDIHDYVEIQNDNGQWEFLVDAFDCIYYRPQDEISEYNQPKSEHPYGGRNYNLFAILANVRNGWYGCDTDEGYKPISMPKGIPSDASDDYKNIVKDWGVDGHSHSYFTLQELLDYDWEQTTINYGVVGPDNYKVWKEKGKPESWCGSVGGMSTILLTNEQMDIYLKNPQELGWLIQPLQEKALKLRNDLNLIEDDGYMDTRLSMLQIQNDLRDAQSAIENIDNNPENLHPYTKVQWEESYKNSVGAWFFERTIPQLKAFAPLGDYRKIRMVFFFDN